MPYKRHASTKVVQDGDRVEIHTDPRRASAILQVLSGGTLEEVGANLKVTRERVRQYLQDAGLTPSIRLLQRPHQKQQTENRIRFTNARRRARMERMRVKQRERVVAAIAYVQEFSKRHGRAPIFRELAIGLGIRSVTTRNSGALLVSYLKRHVRRHSGTRRILGFIYRKAGVAVRAVGYRGSIQAERKPK